MKDRTGEKIAWTGGLLGAVAWMPVLSAVFLFQGKIVPGLAGMALAAVALVSVVRFAPWRLPHTPYWKLMLVPYAVLLLSGVWVIWSLGGLRSAGLNWWGLLALLPILLAFVALRHRRWADFNTGWGVSADAGKPQP